MGRKIRLGVLCGGRSAEHEVSVISARSMLEAIDKDKYETGDDRHLQGRTLAVRRGHAAASGVQSSPRGRTDTSGAGLSGDALARGRSEAMCRTKPST